MSEFETIFSRLQEYVKVQPPANESEGRKLVQEFFKYGDHGWTYTMFHDALTLELYNSEAVEKMLHQYNPKEFC